MMPTLRRLDDGARYYHLTFRQWGAALASSGVLYAAVRLSPLSHKWTLTVALLLLGLTAAAILPLTGNALGVDRYLAAIVRWAVGRKHFTALDPEQPLRGGVLLAAVPIALTGDAGDHTDTWELEDDLALRRDGAA